MPGVFSTEQARAEVLKYVARYFANASWKFRKENPQEHAVGDDVVVAVDSNL